MNPGPTTSTLLPHPTPPPILKYPVPWGPKERAEAREACTVAKTLYGKWNGGARVLPDGEHSIGIMNAGAFTPTFTGKTWDEVYEKLKKEVHHHEM